MEQLLEAYAADDASPTSGACTLDLPAPLLLWLHRGADVVTVRAPFDSCHKPSRTGRAAYDALTLTTVTSVKGRQITSQQSLDSHCSDTYKDMLAVEEEFGGPKQTAAKPKPLEAGTRICRYDVKADGEGDRIGHLVSAETLTDEQLAASNAVLSRAAVDATCSRRSHTRFGLLMAGAENSFGTLVALDGCAVQQDSGWWRADEQLRRLLR